MPKRRVVVEVTENHRPGEELFVFGYTDLAQWLGISVEAARKRVQRGLDPLELVRAALTERKTDETGAGVDSVGGGGGVECGGGGASVPVRVPGAEGATPARAQSDDFDPLALAAAYKKKLGR